MRTSNFSSRPALSLLILATLVLVQAMVAYWRTAAATSAIDFFTVWSVPHTWDAHGGANIYAADDQTQMARRLRAEADRPGSSERMKMAFAGISQLYASRVDATASPLLYAVIGLTSVRNYDEDLHHFSALSFVCLTGALILACRLLQFSLLSTLFVLVVVLSNNAAVITDVLVGNTNQIQLLLVTLFIFFSARSWRFAAGCILGFGIMLKPNIALIAILLAVLCAIDRDFKRQSFTFLGTGLASLLSIITSSMYFGSPRIWLDFAKSLPHTISIFYPFEHGNVGLAMLIYHFTEWRISIFLLLGLIGLFAYVLFRTRPRPLVAPGRSDTTSVSNSEHSFNEAYAIAGLGCAMMLLSSNLAWRHYYVLNLPITLYMMRSGRIVHYGDVLAAAALVMGSTLTFVAAGAFPQRLVIESLMLNCPTALMVGLTIHEMWTCRKAHH